MENGRITHFIHHPKTGGFHFIQQVAEGLKDRFQHSNSEQIFLDTFVNGDPNNDNINGTQFEHDMLQTQLRHGGDIQGVIDSLDYIQGMGIKGLYVAGSPFINEPWGADSYSPLDLTLLDLHYGNIEKYREMVTEIHNRGSKFFFNLLILSYLSLLSR